MPPRPSSTLLGTGVRTPKSSKIGCAGITGSRCTTLSRVEEGRGGGRLPVAMAGAFAAAPQSGLPWPRFPFPLIEPDVPISGIRLSDWLHRKAHGGRPI